MGEAAQATHAMRADIRARSRIYLRVECEIVHTRLAAEVFIPKSERLGGTVDSVRPGGNMDEYRVARRVKPRSAEFHRKPTPWPPFDIEAFARDSERRLRAADAVDRIDTAPPPPHHPASIAAPERAALTNDVIALPVEGRLVESAARVRVLQAQISTGGVSREVAANVLRLELNALEAETRDAEAEPLAAMMSAMREAVEEIGGITGFTHCVPLQVIVVDADDGSRERVALAVESLGHAVRSVKSLADLPKVASTHSVDAILVSSALHTDPSVNFSRSVRQLAKADRTRVAVFTSVEGASIDHLARDTGAEHCFNASSGAVVNLAAQVAPVLDDLAW
jgi:CheY-like chemotaxis protein